uniref:EGF-like domain-containing protein n=1 Tax=Meloidogyne hapla TaxID=6305 RepID=A0A1I8BYN4_MELHA
MSNLENINIEIQLKGYSNPEFRLPNGRLCTCPKGFIGEHCIQTAIAVLVYNLGPQINSDGNLYETNTVTLVDNFTQPFNSDIRGQQSVSLIGEILGTLLTFTYSVSCAGGTSKDGKRLIGPGCDLNCNTTSKITQNNAICENVKTGYFSQCKWKNGGNLEVNLEN